MQKNINQMVREANTSTKAIEKKFYSKLQSKKKEYINQISNLDKEIERKTLELKTIHKELIDQYDILSEKANIRMRYLSELKEHKDNFCEQKKNLLQKAEEIGYNLKLELGTLLCNQQINHAIRCQRVESDQIQRTKNIKLIQHDEKKNLSQGTDI